MRYPQEIVLKDGREVVMRPLEKSDERYLMAFYKDIPSNDRWYMRYDIMQPTVVRKWFDGLDAGFVHSVIALEGERIVAHASLHLRGYGSTKHIGRLRITVVPEYRHKRLGTWMLLDLIQLAMDKGLEALRADFVAGVEDAAIEAARKLDFFKEAVLEDYCTDQRGNKYDLVIMMKRLHKDWGDF